MIDGGLATQLEHHGALLNDPLWSALCLFTSPELIKKVHCEYLDAGAVVITTSSYQATIPGFQAKGFDVEEAEALLRRSVQLARDARDAFWDHFTQVADSENGSKLNRQRPLVAASIGSYGAYLADGSEFSGNYGPDITLEKLKQFHRRRLQVLTEAEPDLVAFETTPNKLEAQAYVELLHEEDIGIPSWITFNSKDGVNVVSGDSFEDCISLAESCPKVVAVGVNCTPPRLIHGLIISALKVTTKPIVVYPNLGETWDANKKEWMEAGASLIGGCCRTTPETIKTIAEALHKNSALLSMEF